MILEILMVEDQGSANERLLIKIKSIVWKKIRNSPE